MHCLLIYQSEVETALLDVLLYESNNLVEEAYLHLHIDNTKVH